MEPIARATLAALLALDLAACGDSSSAVCDESACRAGSEACCPGATPGAWNSVLALCACDGADADADGDAEPDVPAETEADAPADGDAGTDGGPLTALSLPQAVGGALWADPEVHAEVPLHVVVEGAADAVVVRLGDGVTVDAADGDGDGEWIALLPIAGLADGIVALEVTATRAGSEPLVVDAELGIGREGVQLTDFATVGMAGVPRLHRVGDEAWLTWTDRSAGDAEAWLRKIDGAGRWTTDRVPLVGAAEETLYARTAVGDSSLGILYQSPGSPYVTHFKATAFDGTELLAPLDLDGAGWLGSFGGDVAFDGAGYVAVWRVHDGAGGSEVRWLRVAEGTWEVTGPVVVAAAGAGTAADPIGGFVPHTFVDVAVQGELSLVGFVRGRWDDVLEMEIPKSQLALLRRDGTIAWAEYAGVEGDWTYHRECRVFPVADTFVAVWSLVDLLDTSENPPNLFHATRTDAAGALDPSRRAGIRMFSAVDDRDEPFLLEHAERLGVLGWLDHRAYTEDPTRGRIELYAAAVDEDLTTGAETVYPHARFVAGLSFLSAAPAGTNVMLVWIDERHGSGILDPRPEAWFETVWL